MLQNNHLLGLHKSSDYQNRMHLENLKVILLIND